jgi:hypothetical protein
VKRVLAVALMLMVGIAFAGDAPRPNPHGASDGCGSCHASAPEGVGPPLPVVATCRGCHPTADMHPVDLVPTAVHVPDAFPLEGGRVVCSTCHAEPAHGGPALPPPYHRGGPYENPRDLCWSCHERAPFERTDPHRPLVPRDPTSPTCSACHTTAPVRGAAPEQARLRLAIADTCTATCHLPTPHAGAAEHLGEIVDASVRSALPEGIALTGDGRIACFTCHEVHGDAVADPCRACHGEGP